MEMAGASVTLLRLEDELRQYSLLCAGTVIKGGVFDGIDARG
jgi:hypothetical protein